MPSLNFLAGFWPLRVQPRCCDASGWFRRNSTVASILFLVLLSVYHVNGDFLVGYDQVGNVYLPLSLLREGNPSFTPTELPSAFDWELVTAEGRRTITVRNWNAEGLGSRYAQLRRAGALTPGRPA